jgi:hypothetical protein
MKDILKASLRDKFEKEDELEGDKQDDVDDDNDDEDNFVNEILFYKTRLFI